MKKTLRILVMTVFSLILFQHCQKSDFTVVTGVVRDSITNQPLEGIQVLSNGRSYYSSADGTFSMDIQPGVNHIQIFDKSRKYFPEGKKVIITSGRVNKVNFRLNPRPKPEIETGNISGITKTSATVSAKVSLNNNIAIRYGHCWSDKNFEPTLDNCIAYSEYSGGSGSFTFNSNLNGLVSETIYYVRSYLQTDAGVLVYGNTVAFMTSSVTLNDGLIYHFPFDGNSFDISGNGYVMYSEYGDPTYTNNRFGVANKACHFSTGKWYGYFTPELRDFSVSVWFRKNTVWENAEQHLFQIGDNYAGNADNRFYLTQDVSPKFLSAGIRINGTHGTDYRTSLGNQPSLNTWHHVVAQRKGSKFYLYINGTLMTSNDCPADVLPASGYFNAGGAWIGTGNYAYQQYYGDLDDLRLYNRALTNEEIKYLASH